MVENASYAPAASLPLHCTVMHWFQLNAESSFAALDYELIFVAACEVGKEIEIVSGQRELFGPNGNIPAHVLQPNVKLVLLHNHLFRFLAKNDSLPKEFRWIGAGYRPHVTNSGNRSLRSGTRYAAKHLTLIERDMSKAKVVRTQYKLGTFPF